MDFFLIEIAERAYSYNYMTVRPMTYYVENETAILSTFDIISYHRGWLLYFKSQLYEI